MKPIRRELLNGLFVLVLASLIHAAFEAFHLNFNIVLWALIVMGVAIAVGGYVVLEFVLSAEERERATTESTEKREEKWLKRVGTPARLEMNREGMSGIGKAVEAMIPGSDYTVMYYYGSEGGRESPLMKEANTSRQTIFNSLLERLKRGAIREYKRILCFDNDVLANDHDLKS